MTNLEKFIDTYKDFGIEIIVVKKGNYQIIYLEGPYYNDPEITKSEKLRVGYSGFCSEIHFDMDGKFISQGFYE